MKQRHSIAKRGKRANAAFTFAEILAALMFLAILIPAVLGGITISNRVSVFSERSAIATELAQNKISEFTVNDAWTTADANGDFGTDRPGYRWEQTQTAWDMDNMTVLTVKVYFPVQGSEQSLSLSTLVSSSASSGTSSSSISSASSSQSKQQ